MITVHPATQKEYRVLVSLSTDRETGGGYRQIDEVMEDPQLRAVMLQDALSSLRLMQTKYENLVELEGVWSEVAKVEKETGNVLGWTAAQAETPGPATAKKARKTRRQPA